MDAIQAERADRLHTKTPSGRVETVRRCDYPGCITSLSRYNPNSACYVHAEPRLYPMRNDSRRAKGWG